MTKRKKLTHKPAYRRCKADPTKAVAVWKDKDGGKRRRLLPGDYNSPESRTALEQLRTEVKASTTGKLTKRPPLTVAGLFDAYLKWANTYYRTVGGQRSSSIFHIMTTAKALNALVPHKPAANFGPLDLKDALRRWENARVSRSQCNRRLMVTKKVWKWAVSEQLVPVEVWSALTSVPGLKKGRTLAPETQPVLPVDASAVNAVLPFLNRFVAAMVRLQWHTGMRPGEVCILRRCDIDQSGEVWWYHPEHHKTEHHGKERPVPLGPQAQEILVPLLTDNPQDYLFSPSRAVAESRARRSAMRRTPRWPSHLERNRAKRKRKRDSLWRPGDCYKVHSYEQAVERACDLAFPLPPDLAQGEDEAYDAWRARLNDQQLAEVKAWRKRHRWHPNQLRHAFATRIRKHFGLEAAQVMLGHSRADVTQVYAERNLGLALEVAKAIG